MWSRKTTFPAKPLSWRPASGWARVAQDHLNVPTATVHLQPSIFLSAVDPPRLGGIVTPKWFPLWLKQALVAMVDRVCDPIVGPLSMRYGVTWACHPSEGS